MRPIHAGLLLLTAIMAPAVSYADSIDTFTITGPTETSTFSVAASPVVATSSPNDFTITGVSTVTNGTAGTSSFDFYGPGFGGGLTDLTTGLDFFGAVLFTGTTAAPTFTPGSYAFSSTAGGATDTNVTVTQSTAVTPEPSSLMLLGTGALGVYAVSRRRLA